MENTFPAFSGNSEKDFGDEDLEKKPFSPFSVLAENHTPAKQWATLGPEWVADEQILCLALLVTGAFANHHILGRSSWNLPENSA